MAITGSEYFAHPTAEVSPDAKIGAGTKIWHQAQVRENASIGRNSVIGRCVYVDFGVRIGEGVKIQSYVSVYHGVTLEDGVFVGPSATFTNDMHPRAFNGDFKVVPTLVKKGASIGANATIVCGTTIGEYAMVGAGAVVTKDVPAHGLVLGNPARLAGFVCRCGMRAEREKDDGKSVVLKCGACGERFSVPAGTYTNK